ncbi:hypothetical protein [Sodalis sp.]|uniref:hypothetical protein n=1 Tax=Sodalis sp. (in: enterobacteria) TaxID=1898979 RepID=UPI003872EE86
MRDAGFIRHHLFGDMVDIHRVQSNGASRIHQIAYNIADAHIAKVQRHNFHDACIKASGLITLKVIIGFVLAQLPYYDALNKNQLGERVDKKGSGEALHNAGRRFCCAF